MFNLSSPMEYHSIGEDKLKHGEKHESRFYELLIVNIPQVKRTQTLAQ